MTTAVEYFDKTAGVRGFIRKGKDILTGKNIKDTNNAANKAYDKTINEALKRHPGASMKIDQKKKTLRFPGLDKKSFDNIRKNKQVQLNKVKKEKYKTYGARGVVGAGAVGATTYASSKAFSEK